MERLDEGVSWFAKIVSEQIGSIHHSFELSEDISAISDIRLNLMMLQQFVQVLVIGWSQNERCKSCVQLRWCGRMLCTISFDNECKRLLFILGIFGTISLFLHIITAAYQSIVYLKKFHQNHRVCMFDISSYLLTTK